MKILNESIFEEGTFDFLSNGRIKNEIHDSEITNSKEFKAKLIYDLISNSENIEYDNGYFQENEDELNSSSKEFAITLEITYLYDNKSYHISIVAEGQKEDDKIISSDIDIYRKNGGKINIEKIKNNKKIYSALENLLLKYFNN